MPYVLGVDLGTTYTAAAVARGGRAEPFTLGVRRAAIPSVVYLSGEDLLVGEPAERRAAAEPRKVAREFKRRVGDPTPLLLGASPVAAELLMAKLLAWVVEQVTTTEGEPPARLAVTHPANWGEYKLDLLRQAIRHVGLSVDRFVPEPVAAATFYATQRPLEPGSKVAVYDLGGGTFDAAVVEAGPQGFRLVGRPDGIERLGGIDFDHAVFGHVVQALGLDLDALDPDDVASRVALTQLRHHCAEAKEALSSDTDVAVPAVLPGRQTQIRLNRTEFEDMIRPALSETLSALRRTIASGDLQPSDISAVLLVGGSSRIPLVAQLVTADLGRPIAVDARPKDAISLGAALAGAQDLVGEDHHDPGDGPHPLPAGPSADPPIGGRSEIPAPPWMPADVGTSAEMPPPAGPPPSSAEGGRRRTVVAAAAAALAIGAAVGIGVALDLPGDDDAGPRTTDDQPTSTSAPTPSTTAAGGAGEAGAGGDTASSGRLTFPRLGPPWQEAAGEQFVYEEIAGAEGDFAVVEEREGGDWIASVLVGSLRDDTTSDDPEFACGNLLVAMIGDLYREGTPFQDIRSEGTTIDGHPAWLCEAEADVSAVNPQVHTETVLLVVVDVGEDEDTGDRLLSVFFANYPTGDAELRAGAEQALGTLRVND